MIGEVKASISRERLKMMAVRNFDAFIDFLNDTPESRKFLTLRHIERSYVIENLTTILDRMYFNPENDYYLTLGLAHSATAEQIHDRWKSLMIIYHPDKNRDNGGYAGRCATKINEAYSVLKDPRKRMEYDRKILHRKPPPGNPQRDFRRDRVVRETMRGKRHKKMSPHLRKTLANLILPLWLLFCVLILLFLFFEKKSSLSSDHLSPTMKELAKEADSGTTGQLKAEFAPVRNLDLEVRSFLDRYRAAYEKGDMDGLFALFSSADTENSRMNFEGLQKRRQRIVKYKKVRYFINNVELQDRGETITVNGEYRIEGIDENKDDKDVHVVFQGDIHWTLVREDGDLKIGGIAED